MAIQILGLRPYYDKKAQKQKKKHKLFKEVESVRWLFENIDSVIQDIPESERWNVYYTALNCQPKAKGLRRFQDQKVIPFDIDGIDLEKQSDYLRIFFDTTQLDPERSAVVCSGNGLQIIVELDEPFSDANYFDQKRLHYKAICERVTQAFKREGLPGECDPAVWSGARIMRLPRTENRKGGVKGTKQATLIRFALNPQKFDWEELAKLPEVNEDEHIKDWNPAKYPKIDGPEVIKQCKFINWAISTPSEVREPHYYAAMSIIGRFDNGRDIAHRLAESIRDSGSDSSIAGFSHSEIESKIDQALEASGPRTCKGIDNCWGKCKECPLFKKISSPISIKGEGFIATKDSGFHKPIKLGNGQIRLVPAYEDLLKYFDLSHPHVSTDEGLIFTFNGKYYEHMKKNRVKNFALKNFRPFVEDKVRGEFQKLVECENIVGQDFFLKSTRGLLNFNNTVLNFETMETLPHTKEYGFRYALDYEYAPEAKSPKFDKFLDEITCGDESLQKALLQFMGYALSGQDCWAAKALMLTGEGANGKSTFIQLMMELAGEKNVSALTLSSMKKNVSIALLEDKLFNVSEETPDKSLVESSTFKNLISGGGVEAKRLYYDAYFIKNRAKLIFACNELPPTRDATDGLFRRLLIVPFRATFKETFDPASRKFLANTRILNELVGERSGIMNRVIEAYRELSKNRKFTLAESIGNEIHQYKLDNDPLAYWFEESGRIKIHRLNGKEYSPTLADLHASYSQCLEFELAEKPVSIRKMMRRMRAALPDFEERLGVKRDGTKTAKVLFDVELVRE